MLVQKEGYSCSDNAQQGQVRIDSSDPRDTDWPYFLNLTAVPEEEPLDHFIPEKLFQGLVCWGLK